MGTMSTIVGISHRSFRNRLAFSIPSDHDLRDLYIVPEYDLHVSPTEASLNPSRDRVYWDCPGAKERNDRGEAGFFIHPYHAFPLRVSGQQVQMINKTGRIICATINGERTGEDVYRNVADSLRKPDASFRASVYRFMQEMVGLGQVSVSPFPIPRMVTVTGSADFHVPQHISVEITANCNIKCLHCYGTFAQARTDAVNAEELLSVLQRLKTTGLRVIELTGGECTTHPDFGRILRWCVENLAQVGVLTNGVSLKDEHFDILCNNPHKLMVQICINGGEEYHDRFTKAPNSYKRAMAAMNRLARAGILIRSPMNLTWDNYLQIEETCRAVLDNGAHSFLSQWVNASYGRAQDNTQSPSAPLPAAQRTELPREFAEILRQAEAEHSAPCEHIENGLNCYQRAEIMSWWLATMRKLATKYPGAVLFELSEDDQARMKREGTCGAGRRSLYIASNGRVGLCPMSVESGIPGFGSISSDGDLEAIVNSDFSKHLASIPAPNPVDCAGCPHEREHANCLLHGIRQYMKTPTTCKWGQNHNVQRLIDTGFHSLSKNIDGGYDVPEVSHCGSGCGAAVRSDSPKVVQLSSRFELAKSN